jgi:hypothetical protein
VPVSSEVSPRHRGPDHDHVNCEITVDHAAPGVQVPRHGPSTALAGTTHL